MSQVTELLVRIKQQGDDQLVKLQGTFKTLGQQTAAANVNFKELAQELKKVQAGSSQSINNLKGYSAAWREIANSVDTASDEFKIARQEADALDARLKTFQGVQTTVASNFRNIATAANQAAAAMRTTTGLMRDPFTGAYRGVAGVTQYGAPIGPAMPPDYAGRIAQQQQEADAQARRDARRRQIMEQRAAYVGITAGTRDPRTGALIAGGVGNLSEFRAVGTQYAQPIGPALPPARRTGFLPRLARTGGAVAAAGIFGGFEGTLGAGIGAALGGPLGAATGGAIGAQVGMARQALGATATYTANIDKQRTALAGLTKNYGQYQTALKQVEGLSTKFAIPQEIVTRQFTKLAASVIGAGGTLQDAEKAFRGVAAGVRGTGGSLQDLDSALTATAQVFSKGKVSAEELRQQIGERLPGAFTLFAQSLEMTPAELDKALEDGKVTLQDFMKFSEKLFQQFGKSSEAIVNSPAAAGDRLQLQLSKLQENIGRLLQPIGAAFQNTFAGIVVAINQAISALIRFFNLNAADKVEQYAAEVQRLEKAEATASGQARNRLGTQLSTARANLKIAQEQRKLRMAGAGTGAKPEGLPGAETGAGGETKTKKAREAVEISKKEAALRVQISLAKRQEDELTADYLTKELKILKINEELRAKQIGALNADTQRNEAADEYTASLNKQRNAMVDLLFAVEKSRKDEKNQLEDIAAQYGIINAKQAEQLNFDRQINELVEKRQYSLNKEKIDELIAKLKELKEIAKTFGGQVAKSFAEVVRSSGDLAANLGQTLGNAFLGLSDVLTEFVTTGKASFADFARSVLADMSRILIQFAMFQTLKSIVPGGSALGKFLGFANGGIMTANGPLELKRYAAGGIASSPQLAMFGEGSRPEAYVPLPDGRTIPVTMKGGAGGGVNVSVNVDASGSNVSGDSNRANQLGKVVGLAVQQELIKQKRPGGLLA
jgi:lambda family phage tail tape measure protein